VSFQEASTDGAHKH